MVSSAWEEYKQRHGVVTKSSTKKTKKTSPKKTPVKSPVKTPVKLPPKQSPSKKSPSKKTHTQQLLGVPTLANVPREVGEHISSFLPSKSVVTMQRTTKRTKEFTQKQLEEICKEFPTQQEVVNYVKDILLGSFGIHFLVLPGSLPIGTIEFTLLSEGGEIKRYSNAIDENADDPPRPTETVNYANVAAYCTKFVDPPTMNVIMRRRKGCNKMPMYAGDYDVYMVRVYIDTILRPIMRYLLEEKEIDTIFFSPKEVDIDILPLKPVPIVIEELRIYRLAIMHLHFASNWCIARGYLSPDRDELENNPHDIVRSRLKVVYRAYVEAATPGADEVLTTSNLLEYIQLQLNTNKPVRVAFLSIEEVEEHTNLLKIRSVYELVLKDANSGTYTRRGYYIVSNETVYESSSGPEAYQRILSTKLVPGIVDLFTAKAIVQEKGSYERQWYDEIAPTIRGALRFVGTSLNFNFGFDLPTFKLSMSHSLNQPSSRLMSTHFNQLLTLLRWFESQPTPKKVPNMIDPAIQMKMAVSLYKLVHNLGLLD